MPTVARTHVPGLFWLVLVLVQDWYVDGDAPGCEAGTGTELDPFCSIQDAVDAAADGDTVHIAQGTYFENVVVAKDLTLIGTDGDLLTLVNGTASGSVVHVQDAAVTLRGLTLTNGSGTPYAVYTGTYDWGGGLLVGPFHPGQPVSLVDCTVVGNSADFGGGIMAFGGTAPLTLSNTTVCANSTTIAGGGVWTNHPTTLAGCEVRGNTTSYRGGGLSTDGFLTLTNTTVTGNTAEPPCRGSCHDARGGGIYALYGYLTVDRSSLTGNAALTDLGEGKGGAIAFYDGALTLTNSTVTGNTSNEAGGIYGFYTETVLVSSTVAHNSATSYAGGIWNRLAPTTVLSSILWQNTPSQLDVTAFPTLVEFSCVEGGWPGKGNLDSDPLFVDPLGEEFRLLPGSPCVDAGDNRAVPGRLFFDRDGKRRFLDDPATLDTGRPGRLLPIVDMGAHELGVDLAEGLRGAGQVPVPPARPQRVR